MKWPSKVLLPFLTLDCNNRCPYCINRQAPDQNLNFSILAPGQWIDFIESLDGVEQVILNGGEPAIYPGFPEVISALAGFSSVAIGTNYSSASTQVFSLIKPYPGLFFDGSFHPDSQSFGEVSGNILHLLYLGFHVRVHMIDYPNHTIPPSFFLDMFRALGIECFLHPFMGKLGGVYYPDPSFAPMCGMKSRSKVTCPRGEFFPIAPDGNIYFCHYLMYSQKPSGIIGHIGALPPSLPESLPCDHFGFCSPCDFPKTVQYR